MFSGVTTVTLFGQKYATAGHVLLALSIGYYVSIALGFNVYVLQVYGKLKYLVYSNVGVAVVSLALAFALTPRWGAIGAASPTAQRWRRRTSSTSGCYDGP